MGILKCIYWSLKIIAIIRENDIENNKRNKVLFKKYIKPMNENFKITWIMQIIGK